MRSAIERGVSLIAAVLVVGCGGRTTPSPSDTASARPVDSSSAVAGENDIVIGAPWPWSTRGDFLYGQGVRMAVEEVNAAGGVNGEKLRIEPVDDRESVDEGRLVAQRFAERGRIAVVVGHMQSYVTVPAAAVYNEAGIVLVAPTSTDGALTSQGYQRVFRVLFTDRDAGQQMAEVAKALHVTRVGIFYIRNSYGRSLANAFELRASNLGIGVIDRQSYDPGSTSTAQFEDIVRNWKERGVDGVFLAGEAGPAGRFAREVKRQQLNAILLGGDALGIPELIAEGGDAVNGLIFPTPFHPDEPRERVRQFTREFERRFGRGPDALAALGYDAVRVVAHAMQVAKSSEPGKIAKALHELRDWEGVTGVFTFNAAGDQPTKRIVKAVVSDGRFAFLDEQQPLRLSAR